MKDFEHIEGIFKTFMKSIQEHKREAFQMLKDVPEGAQRDELSKLISMAVDIKDPTSIMKAANIAKEKAKKIKEEQVREDKKAKDGDKSNSNK